MRDFMNFVFYWPPFYEVADCNAAQAWF